MSKQGQGPGDQLTLSVFTPQSQSQGSPGHIQGESPVPWASASRGATPSKARCTGIQQCPNEHLASSLYRIVWGAGRGDTSVLGPCFLFSLNV